MNKKVYLKCVFIFVCQYSALAVSPHTRIQLCQSCLIAAFECVAYCVSACASGKHGRTNVEEGSFSVTIFQLFSLRLTMRQLTNHQSDERDENLETQRNLKIMTLD